MASARRGGGWHWSFDWDPLSLGPPNAHHVLLSPHVHGQKDALQCTALPAVSLYHVCFHKIWPTGRALPDFINLILSFCWPNLILYSFVIDSPSEFPLWPILLTQHTSCHHLKLSCFCITVFLHYLSPLLGTQAVSMGNIFFFSLLNTQWYLKHGRFSMNVTWVNYKWINKIFFSSKQPVTLLSILFL